MPASLRAPLRLALGCLLLAAPSRALPQEELFDEEVLAWGKGFKITRAELDEAFIALKANKASLGLRIDAQQQMLLEARLLEKLVHARLIRMEATEEDLEQGRRFLEEQMEILEEQMGSAEAARQHIVASGVSVEYFKEQLLEEGITREVIRREVVGGHEVGQAEIESYYQENQEGFAVPERARIRHIYLALADPRTGERLPEEAARRKEELMESLEERLAAGEDFPELAREHSEDPATRANGGEIVMIKGQSALELEIPVFRLQPGDTSKIIHTPTGMHLVRMLERHPGKVRDLETVSAFIRNQLELDYVQKRLPPYLEELKEKAGLEFAVREEDREE